MVCLKSRLQTPIIITAHPVYPVSLYTPCVHLGDVGDGGRLRCLYGKVDTTISCMCTCSVGSAQCSGCVVYGPGAMAAI